MTTYSVLTTLRHAMGSRAKKHLLLVLALLSVPVVDTLVKGNQIPVGHVVIPLLLGWGALVLLRLSTSKRLGSLISIGLSEREIIYEPEGESPIRKNFNDIRRISERKGEGLGIQFFDAKDEILISGDTTEYAEINRTLATEFFLEQKEQPKILAFASVGGVGAIVFELLALKGNVLHGMVAITLGLVVGFELLSIPRPGTVWRRTALSNRIAILSGILIFVYSIVRVIVPR